MSAGARAPVEGGGSGDRAQAWHQAVEGTWHGWPSIFDGEGRHLGYVRADRSIFIEGDQRLIRVDTTVDCTGVTRARLEHAAHLLRVKHVEGARVYEGIDFVGAGYPYGSLVLGQDYCIPWRSDNRVAVHVLPDEKTQAYSTVLYQGPLVHAVINGVYVLSHDYETNPETRRVVDAHTAAERVLGPRPHLAPVRKSGEWRGEVEVYAPNQELVGRGTAALTCKPIDLYRAEMTMTVGGLGGGARPWRFVRARHESSYFYEGPDLHGNALAYGRALFTTQHVWGEARRIRGREFLLDESRMSVVWEIFHADRPEHIVHGVLTWRDG